MVRPKNFVQYNAIDLKLGIKSSLPTPKATLALLFMFWKSLDTPSEILYSKTSGDGIIIDDSLKLEILKKYGTYCEKNGISNEKLLETINGNQLFQSQLEALIVAFELIWRIAKIKFNDNRGASSERTGGNRYPKIIIFTKNIDVIDLLLSSNEDEYSKILLSWVGLKISFDPIYEQALIRLLMCLSEEALYKLSDNGKNIVFNNSSLYSSILEGLEGNETVDINGDSEAKGSLRILKSSLVEELNIFLKYTSGKVSLKSPHDKLQKYQKRVNAYLSLTKTCALSTIYSALECSDESLSIEELSEILRDMCAKDKVKVVATHIFGIKYGKIILENGYDKSKIIEKAGLTESFYTELDKGIKIYKCLSTNVFEISHESSLKEHIKFSTPQNGCNTLFYGVPGCGKSHFIKTKYNLSNDSDNMERVVFHPDYAYSDFVGQILPKINHESKCIEYKFLAGPFTRILKKCENYPQDMQYLIIEEINRGNAPAIFGEIFQLLDRDTSGNSDYGISNPDISEEVHGDRTTKIVIPNNLTILATMNTADQNVFTLDTAFKRRWKMKAIRNKFDDSPHCIHTLCGTTLTWKNFAESINKQLLELSGRNIGSEDNRLGVYFLKDDEMDDVEIFSEKVLMYLWNDAVKYDRTTIFKDKYTYLEELIDAFKKKKFDVFNENLKLNIGKEEQENNSDE